MVVEDAVGEVVMVMFGGIKPEGNPCCDAGVSVAGGSAAVTAGLCEAELVGREDVDVEWGGGAVSAEDKVGEAAGWA